MKLLTNKEIKKIMLNILDHVVEFCDENEIEYMLAWGTLLGAIREKGMIPWDYDIDIAMTRKNYLKFIDLYSKKDCSQYHIESTYLDDSFLSRLVIISDTKTINEHCFKKNNKSKSVNIEIYPIDFLPEDENEREVLYKKVNRLFVLNQVKNIEITRDRNIIKNLFLILLKGITVFFPPAYFIKRINDIVVNPDYIGSNFSGCSVMGKLCCRTIHPTSEWNDYMLAVFEGKEYKIPTHYDAFLRLNYGNYMIPPSAKDIRMSERERDKYHYYLIESNSDNT